MRDLEYQAGQEDEAGAEKGKEPQEKGSKDEKNEKAAQETPAPDQEEAEEEQEQGEEGQEGPINEDTEEGYEQRQFATPQVIHNPLSLQILYHTHLFSTSASYHQVMCMKGIVGDPCHC